MDYMGVDFTWSGIRAAGTRVWCWLDRICATTKRILMFLEYKVYHQPIAWSDHAGLLLRIKPIGAKCGQQSNFGLELMWLRN